MFTGISKENLEFLIFSLISLANIGWTIWSSKKRIQPEVEKLESEVTDLITKGAKLSIEMVLQRLADTKKSERDWRNYAVTLQRRLIEKGDTPPPFVPSESEPKIQSLSNGNV